MQQLPNMGQDTQHPLTRFASNIQRRISRDEYCPDADALGMMGYREPVLQVHMVTDWQL